MCRGTRHTTNVEPSLHIHTTRTRERFVPAPRPRTANAKTPCLCAPDCVPPSRALGPCRGNDPRYANHGRMLVAGKFGGSCECVAGFLPL